MKLNRHGLGSNEDCNSCEILGEVWLADDSYKVWGGCAARPVWAVSMSQWIDAQSRLWFPDSDSEGNRVDPKLNEAAIRVWERARRIVIRYLADDSETAEILEQSIDGAARSTAVIRNAEAYLLTAVARKAVKENRMRRRMKPVDPFDLHALAISVAPVSEEERLDEKRRLELFLASLDERSLEMFHRRALDQDWEQIAADMGYSSAHSAEVQFGKKMKWAAAKIRARFGLKA